MGTGKFTLICHIFGSSKAKNIFRTIWWDLSSDIFDILFLVVFHGAFCEFRINSACEPELHRLMNLELFVESMPHFRVHVKSFYLIWELMRKWREWCGAQVSFFLSQKTSCKIFCIQNNDWIYFKNNLVFFCTCSLPQKARSFVTIHRNFSFFLNDQSFWSLPHWWNWASILRKCWTPF